MARKSGFLSLRSLAPVTKPVVMFWILAAATISFVKPSALAQNPQINNATDLTHAPVPGVGHDYQHMLGETVNQADGSVSIKINFPTPKGRGISIPLSWSYSSGSVNPLDIDSGIISWYNPADHGAANPVGWTYFDSLPIGTAQVWSVNGNGYDPNTGFVDTSDTWIPCNFQSGMTFRDVDGVWHDLSIYAQAPASNQNTGGYIYTCSDLQTFTGFTSQPNGDGQVAATLVPNTASQYLASTTPSSGAFAVVDKNGTVYTFPGGNSPSFNSGPGGSLSVSEIEDRNGNQITLTSDPLAPYKDTAGRELYRTKVTGSPAVMTIGGTGDYTAEYGSTSVSYPIDVQPSSESEGGEQVGCLPFPKTVSGSRPTLSTLTLPNYQTYQFFYGSTNPNDQTILNEFGLINEIIYPDGGWVKYSWALPPSGVFNALSETGGQVSIGAVNGTIGYKQVPHGCSYQYQVPVLTMRQVSFDGTNVAQSQTYVYSTSWGGSNGVTTGWTTKSTTVTTTDKEVGRTAQTVYHYLPMQAETQKFAPGSIVPQIPLESTIAYYDWGASNPSKIVTKTWLDQFSLTSETTQIIPTNQISEKVFSYGQPSCAATNSMVSSLRYLAEEDDWDFGVLSYPQSATTPGIAITPPSITPTKRTIYQYRCFSPNTTGSYNAYSTGVNPYPGVTLPPQVSSVTVEAGNTIQAVTEYTYDGSGPAAFTPTIDPQPIQFDGNYKGSATSRGNITNVKRCLAPLPTTPGGSCSNSVTASYVFDSAGLPLSSTDGRQFTTHYGFLDNYSDSASAPTATDAFLTSITRPPTYGASVSHVSTFSYTWASGLLASSTEENTNTTTSYIFDTSYRLHKIVYPPDANNGNAQGYRQFDPDDTAPTPSVTTTTLTCAQNCNPASGQTVTVQTFDGMGHVTDTSTTDIDSSSGGLNYVHTTYDGEGRPLSVSNPYWSTTNGTTTYSYDAFGRKITQTQQDGSSRLQWCYDGAASVGQTNCHSHIGNGEIGSYIDEADENGNDWQSTSDSFGRLIQVEEPNGTSINPSMETDYTYDALNDLVSVSQNGTSSSPQRTRSFSYDPLGRLLMATNPEIGAITYTYDGNSNVSTKTDLRGIKVSYNYDELNREISRNYNFTSNGASTSEPSPCHQFDVSLALDNFPINQVTAEWMAPAGTCPAIDHAVSAIPSGTSPAFNSRVVLSHDVWGHVTSETQCPTGPSCSDTHTFTYAYDLASGMKQFNNGIAGTTSGGPSLTFNVGLDVSEKVRSIAAATAPWSTPATVLLADTTMQQKMGSPAYDVWGHLVAEQVGVTTGGTAGIEILSKYDNRGRIQSETAGGHQATVIPTGSFGVIAVNGIEQSALIPATASVTISFANGNTQDQGPVTWYPCGNQGCPDPEFDQGNIGVSINGTLVTVAWGQPSNPSDLASYLASAINAQISTVTAQASGSTVQLTANNPNTAGSSITLSPSVTDTTPGGVFTAPSFFESASGSTFVGGGGPVYDTGQVTVAITSSDNSDTLSKTILATTSPVTWQSGSTDKGTALALKNAINSVASTYVTATLDSSGNSVILTGVGNDSSTLNYGLKVTVTDTTASNNTWAPVASLPSTSFQFADSSLDGGSNGNQFGSYALVYSYLVPEGGYRANSNLQGYSDSVMGDWAFQYDTLNRLTSFVPAPNAPSLYVNTTGCFGYDAFGNRTAYGFVTTTDCTGVGTTAQFDSGNHVTFISQTAPVSYSASKALNTLLYDDAGNLYTDANNYYAYDSEGRVCAVLQYSVTGSQPVQYIYDASGIRVAKATFTGSIPGKDAVCLAPGKAPNYGVTTQYLLNLAGEQVTELGATGNWLHTNLWSGAHLSATYDTAAGGALHFHISDPLGSRRVQVDVNGKVEETCQSLPFGDELNCSQTSLATADDATEHHFTGKERDKETGFANGNDYFGARYYASSMGRFMSPDWSAHAEPVPYSKLGDPQSLDLYAYGANNPLVKTDADGHAAAGSGCRQGKAACDAAIQKSNADFNKNTKKLGNDLVKLAKSGKISVEAGIGEEKKVTVAGVKGVVGGSAHMKSTFALGDLRKSTVAVEVEGGAGVKVGDHSMGPTGSVGLEGDLQGNTSPKAELAGEGPGVEQGLTGDRETTFGGADYDGVGGGVSLSVSTEALHEVGQDFASLFGIGSTPESSTHE